MRFGVREICDVVFKATDTKTIGSLTFDKGMPVLYFDTLKTSSLEGAATTVYAQGGKGNTRLVAWEGDKTVTFKMQDALISAQSFSILSGAGLVKASESKPILVHTTETAVATSATEITIEGKASKKGDAYAVPVNGGELSGLPIKLTVSETGTITATGLTQNTAYVVDYYVEKTAGASEITIEASKFAGYYYVEASTLFRDEATGTDKPAEFVIPKAKVQSNFTFTMAPTGDPSAFDFTLDAFPEYTAFDKTKKVIAALQIVE